MTARHLATVLAIVGSLFAFTACGGGDPEGEATWETHSTAPDESAGGEASEEDGADDAAADPGAQPAE